MRAQRKLQQIGARQLLTAPSALAFLKNLLLTVERLACPLRPLLHYSRRCCCCGCCCFSCSGWALNEYEPGQVNAMAPTANDVQLLPCFRNGKNLLIFCEKANNILILLAICSSKFSLLIIMAWVFFSSCSSLVVVITFLWLSSLRLSTQICVLSPNTLPTEQLVYPNLAISQYKLPATTTITITTNPIHRLIIMMRRRRRMLMII